MISVVVGYRNRDIERVKRSLDSLSKQCYVDFELIFVDYGSDLSIATEIKQLVTYYKFVKYIYTDTIGWFWNRAHALNIGIETSKGNIILIFDIDVIVLPNFLTSIAHFDYKNHFYTFNSVYYPENYDYLSNNLFNDVHKFSMSYVGLCAVNKDHIACIKGFDEYYMVWGVEDDAFYDQLMRIGISRVIPEFKSFPIIHQWHEVQSPKLPSLWYLNMLSHFLSKDKNFKLDKIWRDSELFTLVHKGNYKSYQCLELDMSRPFMVFTKILFDFYKMHPNQIAWFEFTSPQDHIGKLDTIITCINKILDRIRVFNYRFTKLQKLNTSASISLTDIQNFIFYFVGTNRSHIADYYFKKNKGYILLVFKKSY